MQFIAMLLSGLSKEWLLSLALALIWRAFGEVATYTLAQVQLVEAEHPDWTGRQKFDAVFDAVLGRYRRLAEWKWILNFLIESAVAKQNTAKAGGTGSAEKFTRSLP